MEADEALLVVWAADHKSPSHKLTRKIRKHLVNSLDFRLIRAANLSARYDLHDLESVPLVDDPLGEL